MEPELTLTMPMQEYYDLSYYLLVVVLVLCGFGSTCLQSYLGNNMHTGTQVSLVSTPEVGIPCEGTRCNGIIYFSID
jgi:hypothetical protein